MTYKSDYELTSVGSVKVKNTLFSFDKRNGYLSVEFDARGKTWTGGDYAQAFLIYGGVTKGTLDLKSLTNRWTRYSIKWYIASEHSLVDLSSQYPLLYIFDEDDTAQTFPSVVTPVDIDLDPVEYHMSVSRYVDFGDDSTPSIEFTLTDLHNKNQFIDPLVTDLGDSSTSTGVTVTHGKVGNTTYANGYLVLDGVKFKECNLQMNSLSANKAHWYGEATKYTVATPTLQTGENSYSINLRCINL